MGCTQEAGWKAARMDYCAPRPLAGYVCSGIQLGGSFFLRNVWGCCRSRGYCGIGIWLVVATI